MREGKRKKKRPFVWMLWLMIFSVGIWGLTACSGKKEDEKPASAESKNASVTGDSGGAGNGADIVRDGNGRRIGPAAVGFRS